MTHRGVSMKGREQLDRLEPLEDGASRPRPLDVRCSPNVRRARSTKGGSESAESTHEENPVRVDQQSIGVSPAPSIPEVGQSPTRFMTLERRRRCESNPKTRWAAASGPAEESLEPTGDLLALNARSRLGSSWVSRRANGERELGAVRCRPLDRGLLRGSEEIEAHGPTLVSATAILIRARRASECILGLIHSLARRARRKAHQSRPMSRNRFLMTDGELRMNVKPDSSSN
jgi:hypothetical protein